MRALRIIGGIVVGLLVLPLLILAGAVVFANSEAGARLIERQAASLTGGTVVLAGFDGGLPNRVRIGRIEIHDKAGPWLTIEEAELVWSPLRLLSGVACGDSLTARRIAVARLPVSSGSSGGGFSIPLPVQVQHIRADRIEIAAPVIGTPLALSLEGNARASALDNFAAGAAIHDLDAGGTYHVVAALAPDTVHLQLAAEEPTHGAAAKAAGLPDLGKLTLTASMNGPRNAAATRVGLLAGPLRADLAGTVDMDHLAGNLDLTASAPAMAPAPSVSFQALEVAAHVKGPFATPEATGHVSLAGLAAGGATVRQMSADVSGSRGGVQLTARADGVQVPGPKPDLFAADPLHLTADVRLDQPGFPLHFALSQKLIGLTGAGTAQPVNVSAHLTAPDLGPFGALGGVDIAGSTALDLTVKQAGSLTVTADGTLGLTGGPAPAPALIGPAATLGVTASLADSDITVSRLTLTGAGVQLNATGQNTDGALTVDAKVELPNLSLLAPTLSGRASLHASATGAPTGLALKADVQGDIATPGVPVGHVTATLAATGLPAAPAGHIAADGQLDGAPLSVAATIARTADGATTATIEKADWRSAHAEGALALAAGAKLPTGQITLRMTRLADLRRLTGQPIGGAINARVELTDRLATAKILAEGVTLPGAAVRRATVDATVADPLGEARVDATLAATGLAAGGTTGNARVTVRGPRTALDIAAQADTPALAGAPATLAARAQLDIDARKIAVASLSATAHGQTLRLLAPARVTFGDTVSVDRLRLGVAEAVLDLAGRVSPTLDVTASLRNLRGDLAALADPAYAADGVVSADAKLTGTPQRPTGSVRVDATGLHLRRGPGSGVPPVSIVASAMLMGRQANVQATLTEGPNRVALTGTAPIDPAAALDLRATGGLDLAMLDPLVAAAGRRVRGQVTLDATVTGTLAAPRAGGTITLAGGEVQDFAQGVHLDRIEAQLTATGDRVQINRLQARAGTGTIEATGSVGLAAPMPLDIRLIAKDATPLASDLLTARLDADLAITGAVQAGLALGGTVTIKRADIRVPETLPPSVPVLNVVRPGVPAPPPPVPGAAVALDLQVTSPGQIFVRGRGLDAELSGRLHVGGTSAAPRPDGGFTMRYGTFSLVGRTLNFASGHVGFNGSTRIDPSLDFVANNYDNSVTSTLTVTGTASDPKIALSAVPTLPQDEVLAHLLFGQSAGGLGPFQLAQIAAALAQISGVAGAGFDPLASLRQGLGLDRLSVGGSGSAPDVEAGRYVRPGVYVGARQATSGGGTQALVQIDLLRGLKLEATAGTGGGTAQGSGQSNGTGVGLTYQFQY